MQYLQNSLVFLIYVHVCFILSSMHNLQPTSLHLLDFYLFYYFVLEFLHRLKMGCVCMMFILFIFLQIICILITQADKLSVCVPHPFLGMSAQFKKRIKTELPK